MARQGKDEYCLPFFLRRNMDFIFAVAAIATIIAYSIQIYEWVQTKRKKDE
jgi:hypothetical protein